MVWVCVCRCVCVCVTGHNNPGIGVLCQLKVIFGEWDVIVPHVRTTTHSHLTTWKQHAMDITEGLGVEIQFHFFFSLSDKRHPWQLEKCWGLWTDFSVTKIKCVDLDKDRHFKSYFWTPMRALTNATPPPLLLYNCFFVLSSQMSYSQKARFLYGTNMHGAIPRESFMAEVHRLSGS